MDVCVGGVVSRKMRVGEGWLVRVAKRVMRWRVVGRLGGVVDVGVRRRKRWLWGGGGGGGGRSWVFGVFGGGRARSWVRSLVSGMRWGGGFG